ncbi:hypothetical protein PR048_009632 [Dryococelus australis]|uniref:Uncharacterized protein n=1 Tax=Dryococelus australis TaxID=614101 RepID=A0ABQ9I1H0_9NEOP|nr:hypothetical protein PR048_009632 [Dryococelus australis]
MSSREMIRIVLNWSIFLDSIAVKLLAFHHGEPGSIPGSVTPGIVPDDAAERRVSQGFPVSPALAFQRWSILTSPSTALKTSLLRTAQISQLNSTNVNSRRLVDSEVIRVGATCSGKRDWGRNGKESVMAFVGDPSQHSPGVIPENHGRPKSGWLNRESNPGRPECESMMIEVNMVRRRNEGTGETGDPRENSPTNGIVRHDSHLRKSSDPAGDSNLNGYTLMMPTAMHCEASATDPSQKSRQSSRYGPFNFTTARPSTRMDLPDVLIAELGST